MNQSHALAGGVGSAFGAALAGVIASTWHIDPTVAANWVTVILMGAGSAAGIAAWFVHWRWPDAPPLPDEVAIPAIITQPPLPPAPVIVTPAAPVAPGVSP